MIQIAVEAGRSVLGEGLGFVCVSSEGVRLCLTLWAVSSSSLLPA